MKDGHKTTGYSWEDKNDNEFDDGWSNDFNQDHQYEDGEVVYQVKSQSVPEIPQKFPKGSKVIHSLYGEGKVLESEGTGPEEKVVIRFLDGARKKFMVRFAPLVFESIIFKEEILSKNKIVLSFFVLVFAGLGGLYSTPKQR